MLTLPSLFSFRRYVKNIPCVSVPDDIFSDDDAPANRQQLERFAQKLRPGISVGQVEHLSKNAPRQERAQIATDMLRKCPKGLIIIKTKDKSNSSKAVSIHWTTQSRQKVLNSSDSCDLSEENLCVVCLERQTDIQLGQCKHESYCQQCLSETLCGWPKGNSVPACPMCRTPINSFVVLQ